MVIMIITIQIKEVYSTTVKELTMLTIKLTTREIANLKLAIKNASKITKYKELSGLSIDKIINEVTIECTYAFNNGIDANCVRTIVYEFNNGMLNSYDTEPVNAPAYERETLTVMFDGWNLYHSGKLIYHFRNWEW